MPVPNYSQEMQRLLPNLQVGSALIYPTGRRTEASVTACGFVVYEIKQNLNNVLAKIVEKRLVRVVPRSVLSTLLTPDAVLVPVPGSAKQVEDGLWVPKTLSEALVKYGLGSQMLPILSRTRAVTKSAGRERGADRPGVLVHYQSLTVNSGLEYPTKIVLIDDVVTRGATLIACASHLREHFPEAEITAFALARTERETDLNDIREMLNPTVQTIYYDHANNSVKRRDGA